MPTNNNKMSEKIIARQKKMRKLDKNIKLQLVKTGDGRAPLRLSFAATTLHTQMPASTNVCVCVAVMFAANIVLAGIKKQY